MVYQGRNRGFWLRVLGFCKGLPGAKSRILSTRNMILRFTGAKSRILVMALSIQKRFWAKTRVNDVYIIQRELSAVVCAGGFQRMVKHFHRKTLKLDRRTSRNSLKENIAKLNSALVKKACACGAGNVFHLEYLYHYLFAKRVVKRCVRMCRKAANWKNQELTMLAIDVWLGFHILLGLAISKGVAKRLVHLKGSHQNLNFASFRMDVAGFCYLVKSAVSVRPRLSVKRFSRF